MNAVAAYCPLAAVPAQQSHPLRQTEAVGPPALTTPLTPPLTCPVHVLLSSLGWAPCLPPQARLLHTRWVLSSCWAPIVHVSRVLNRAKSMTCITYPMTDCMYK